jgi:hypothetical protein
MYGRNSTIRVAFLVLTGAFDIVQCYRNFYQFRSPSVNDLDEKDFILWQKLTRKRTSQSNKYYFQYSSLGELNLDVTLGNPMKGVIGDGQNDIKQWPIDLPSSMQFHKIPLNEVMVQDPDVVGEAAAFNWTSFNILLQTCANHSRHAVVRFFIHWPKDKNPVYLPAYLTNKVEMVKNRGETIPYWADPTLLKAIQQFVTAFGKRYDGDKRLFVIQAGLIGAWGEHHSVSTLYPCSLLTGHCIHVLYILIIIVVVFFIHYEIFLTITFP